MSLLFPLRWALTVAAVMPLVGCSSTPVAMAAPDYDRPVAAQEPRGELHLAVDLEPSQDCEERFDLALYADRAVDLVQWDDAVGRCGGRQVTVRFLSEKLTREKVLERVRGLTRKVEERTGQNPAPAGGKHGDS